VDDLAVTSNEEIESIVSFDKSSAHKNSGLLQIQSVDYFLHCHGTPLSRLLWLVHTPFHSIARYLEMNPGSELKNTRTCIALNLPKCTV